MPVGSGSVWVFYRHPIGTTVAPLERQSPEPSVLIEGGQFAEMRADTDVKLAALNSELSDKLSD